MSHILAYRGPDLSLSNLLHLPDSSLISTSLDGKKQSVLCDGFGVGWYNRNMTSFPAVFKTIRSPLNDDNLINISECMQSDCIFMHQLIIDDTYSAQQVNCQPFKHNQLMFVHSGQMSTFHLIKKDLIKAISTKAFDIIKGHSVSEYIFAFYLSQLDLKKDKYTQKELETALLTTITKLTSMCRKIDRRYHLSLNLAITDHDHFVAIRFMDDFKKKADPLYYAFGEKMNVKNGKLVIKKKNVRHKFVLISSKKLTENDEEWVEIPENHIVSISSLNNVSTKAII